jgi:2-polyprenyl-3-methyl-5-hydroxy-6-metoxy-1,4-benzoquinol methylase
VSAWDGDAYQARFDALAAAGSDVHGEVTFVLAYEPRTVLDAGCGTGRVAIELTRRGVDATGVDIDSSMIATARTRGPDVAWYEHDVASLNLGRTFDAVVMAGNVVLFTVAGTQRAVVGGCARHMSPRGILVCGFQLGRGYTLEQYDADCAASGLMLTERFATWDRQRFRAPGDYAVSVHTPDNEVA